MASVEAPDVVEKLSPAPKTQSPRVAVVGCGYWGKNLVRNFARLGALSAISDADAAVSGTMAGQHGTSALEWDEILASPDIDGVVIATPAERHGVMTRQALEAGKHVFVEKPIALTVEEGRQSVELAEKTGRVLMVGHLLHYHPAFVKLKSLVADRAFGKLQYIYSNRLNLGKIRREENILWSFAPHDLSMILSLVGELPTMVQATGSAYMQSQIADVTTTNLAFANGVNAHIFVSWLHPSKEQKLVLIGEDSMAVFDDRQDWSQKLVIYPHKIEWPGGIPEAIRAEGSPVEVEESEPLRLECSHFLDCIAKNERPITDGREALNVLQVLSMAQDSMNKRAAVDLAGTAPVLTGGASVHESAYVDEGVTLGAGSKVWHFSHILSGSTVGKNCTIGQNVMIGPDVAVGDNCKIQNNVSLYKGVTLEEGVFCGPSAVFTNVNNPRAEVDRKDEFRHTLIKKGATIGANATIVCGHELGRYSFIAAGAVVTSNVPDYALMAGVPAERIGWMSQAGEKLGADLTCPRTGEQYRETPDGNLELVEA
ncbi:MAG: Gfo/Idh/MocA family oxidoreductase [Pseudomonadota bacterium]